MMLICSKCFLCFLRVDENAENNRKDVSCAIWSSHKSTVWSFKPYSHWSIGCSEIMLSSTHLSDFLASSTGSVSDISCDKPTQMWACTQKNTSSLLCWSLWMIWEAIHILQIAISRTVQPNLFSNSYPSKIEVSFHSTQSIFFSYSEIHNLFDVLMH